MVAVRVPALLAPLLLTLGLAGPATDLRPQGGIVQLRTERYQLEVWGSAEEAEEFGRVLELAWPVQAKGLQLEPRLAREERLRVRIHRDREAWESALVAEKAVIPAGLDLLWYRPESGTVHLYRQPSARQTRVLLLQGACQQFFTAAKAKNIDLAHSWFVRGYALHLAQHRFDGERLELGVRLDFDPANLARDARAAWRPLSFGIERIDEHHLTAPELSWSLVRFLLQGEEQRYRKRFERLALGSRGSRLSGAEYARALGDAQALARELADWLERELPPWEVCAGDWEELDRSRVRARASGGHWARALASSDAGRVQAWLVLPEGMRAGLVLDEEPDGTNTVALLESGRIDVYRTAGGESVGLLGQALPQGARERHRLELQTTGESRILFVDGEELYSLDGPRGRMGLCVARGEVLWVEPTVVLGPR